MAEFAAAERLAPADRCPQCDRVNVRTAREISRNYVCMGCTSHNEGPC